jgi:hypothetical protein
MSYERSMDAMNAMIFSNQLVEAESWIQKKKIMKKDRNAVLQNMELATLQRYKGDYNNSIQFLNQADRLIEDRKVNAGQRALSLMTNPRSLPYQAEFFEMIAVHYIKCLNFLQIGQFNAARVEARRANIALNKLNDAIPDKPLKYHDDVLAHVIMGIAYEANGETNNAFIAYRNAVNLFIVNGELSSYMGTRLPDQLACDLMRTARKMQFGSEISYYNRILNVNCSERSSGPGGELIVFWENGRVPIKDELIINFALGRDANGLQIYNNRMDIYSSVTEQQLNDYNFNITNDNISIALPIYERRFYPLREAIIQYPGGKQEIEEIENLNVIAPQSLKDRYARELANAVLRVLAKRAMQEALSSIEFGGDEDEKEKDEKDEERKDSPLSSPVQRDNNKKKESKEGTSESNPNNSDIDLGQIYNVISTLTERADVRSWQNLPATIHYTRIPLKKGMNAIKVRFQDHNNRMLTKEKFNIQGSGKLEVLNLITPNQHLINPTEYKSDNQNLRS